VAFTVALCSLSGLAHAANHAPTIWGTPITSTLSDTWYDFTPKAADADGNKIWFTIANKPSWAYFDASSGRLKGMVPAGTYYNVKISVTDGSASASLAAFNVYVKANTAPTIAGAPATSVALGGTYDFVPSAINKDGDHIWFTIANKPSWAWFNAANGELGGKPAAAGSYANIVIGVTDNAGHATSLPAFAINVTAPNHAPTIAGTPATTVVSNTAYAFQPTAADADKNTLGFSVQNKPSWASFNTATGALTGKPTTANVGTYAGIVISVSDGKLTTSLPAFAVNVAAPPNTAPTIAGAPLSSVKANASYTFQPTAVDANGDALMFSVANKPTWAMFNTITGALSGTPSASEVGTYSGIVVSVSDGKATVSLAPFAVTVAQAANGSVTLNWTPPTQKTDETVLSNLAGYKIQYGTDSAALNQTIDLKTAGVSSYLVENLSPATYYFAIKAYTSTGEESDPSNVVSKVVQ
jgi:hypothetical protein